MVWVWAGVAILAAFIVAMAASKQARRSFERRGGRSSELAPAASSLSFSLIVVVGLLVALALVQPDSVSKLRDDTIDYLPRVLSALIVVILGGVAGTIVSTAAGEAIGRSLGRMGEKIPTVIKGIITAFAAILAASQLGIDTTVVNIFVAASVGGVALAFALIVGLGSRPIATEIANGRALRRLMGPGDTIAGPGVAGTIVALHPTAVEVVNEGANVLVPNSDLAAGTYSISRAPTDVG